MVELHKKLMKNNLLDDVLQVEGANDLDGFYLKQNDPETGHYFYCRDEPTPLFIYKTANSKYWYFGDTLYDDVSLKSMKQSDKIDSELDSLV